MTTLDELARLVDATVIGDGSVEISGAATLRWARAGDISLADHEKLTRQVESSEAAAFVVSADFPDVGRPCLHVASVHATFARLVAHFHPPRQTEIPAAGSPNIHPTAQVAATAEVHPTATVGREVVIADRCRVHANVHVMDGSRLDEDVVLFPNVVLYENTVIGARSILHAGCVVGSYGFGYQTQNGQHIRGTQLGNVAVDEDVEIGANTTIDRGTYDSTRIGAGTKIDNLVQIGHNCHLGRHNLICSQSGLAGSCTTGDYVVLAGNAGISDHTELGNGVKVAAKSGVMQDVDPGQTFVGLPAMPERDFWRMWVGVTRLPELQKQLKQLQREVQRLRKLQRPEAA